MDTKQIENFLDAHEKTKEVINRGGDISKEDRLIAMRNETFEKAALNREWSEEKVNTEREKFNKEYSIERMKGMRISELLKAFEEYERG